MTPRPGLCNTNYEEFLGQCTPFDYPPTVGYVLLAIFILALVSPFLVPLLDRSITFLSKYLPERLKS